MSGVYECHKGCHCNDRCLNKVVQNRIQVKMQLFRTKEKGWGLEACHDIPKGAFICTYAGRLYREADTNSLCTDVQDGDEYFAALDLIETLAPNKDDFESGVVYPDEQESPEEESEESDFESEDETNGFSNENIIAGVRRSSRNKRNGEGRKKVSKKSNSNLMETENDEIMPSQDSFSVEAPTNSAGKLRILYGDKSDECYIMDAKQEGNIGKFFNVSSSKTYIFMFLN
jgi:[histone H3]-N6,N6-dimethyl-lysine9 N-methyltransferase